MPLSEFKKQFPEDFKSAELAQIEQKFAAMKQDIAAKAAAVPATGRGSRTAAKRAAEPETVLRTTRRRVAPQAAPPKFGEQPEAAAAGPSEAGAETTRRGGRGKAAAAAAAAEAGGAGGPPAFCVCANDTVEHPLLSDYTAERHPGPPLASLPCPASPLSCCSCSSGGGPGVLHGAATADAHAVCGGGDAGGGDTADTEARRADAGTGSYGRSSHHHIR